jgi:hypothetical protein
MNDINLQLEEQRRLFLDIHNTLKDIKVVLKNIDPVIEPPVNEINVSWDKPVTVSNLDDLEKRIDGLGEVITKAIEDNKFEQKPVEVKNILDAVTKEVEINNFEDIKKYFVELEKAIKENKPIVNVTKQDLTLPTSPTKPIAVRLSDGKSFYKAITQALSGGSIPSALIRDTGTGQAIAVTGETTVYTERYDLDSSPIIYYGTAVVGSSEDSPVWTVTKYDLSNLGNSSGKVASGVVWTNKEAGDYN